MPFKIIWTETAQPQVDHNRVELELSYGKVKTLYLESIHWACFVRASH